MLALIITLALALCWTVPWVIPTAPTVTWSHVGRVSRFFLFQSLVTVLLLGGALYAAAFTPRPHAVVTGIVLAVLLLGFWHVTSMTVPALLLSAPSALRRSLQRTTESWAALRHPAILLAYTAAWMVPLAHWWPAPGGVLLITWMATAGHWILWFRLYLEREAAQTPPPEEDSPRGGHYRVVAVLGLVALVWFGDVVVWRDSGRTFHKRSAAGAQVYYSRTRFDRTGSQILEMILHSAYAYQHDATYGGACQIGPATLVQNKTRAVIEEERPVPGLEHQFLRYGCPPRGRDDPALVLALYPWILGTRIVTEDFLEYLQSYLEYAEKPTDVFTIAVHIRRGDISPCIGVNLHRYLPNSYYLDQIDWYLEREATKPEHRNKTVQVIIHSVHNSFESFAEFERRNYTVRLSTGTATLGAIWMDLILADVFIMSPSSFSVVPALLKRNGIAVYAPFPFFTKLTRWEGGEIDLAPYHREVRAFKSLCDAQNKTREYPHGVSGVGYLLRNFTGQGILSFLVPS